MPDSGFAEAADRVLKECLKRAVVLVAGRAVEGLPGSDRSWYSFAVGIEAYSSHRCTASEVLAHLVVFSMKIRCIASSKVVKGFKVIVRHGWREAVLE